MTPKISVVIPTYNRADKVGKTIDSALAQTVTDLEVIVIDDGSTDDTAKVLAEKYGDRIRSFAQPNQGGPFLANDLAQEASALRIFIKQWRKRRIRQVGV